MTDDDDYGAPNLDGMWADDLMEFWTKTYSPSLAKRALELFPDMPEGYIAATESLGNYAMYKADAMNLRERGFVTSAVRIEQLCDDIYNKLPAYARW